MAKNSKNLLKLSVLCLIFMFAGVLFLLVYPLLTSGDKALDEQIFVDNGRKPLDGFLVDGNANTLYPFADDTVLQVSSGTVEYLNMQGVSNRSQPVQLNKPQVVNNLKYAVIYDEGGTNYYLFDRYGLVYRAKAKDSIQGASLSADGHVALIMQGDKSKGAVRLMSPEGKHLFDYDIKDRQNSGYLLGAAFSQDGNFLDLSLLNTDGVKMYPLLTRFSLNTLKVVVNYQISYNGALPLILQSRVNSLVLLSESDVFHLVNRKFKRWFSLAELKEAREVHNGIALLASRTFQGSLRLYYVDTSDAEPNENNSVAVGNNPEKLITNANYATLHDGNTVYRINMSNFKSEKFKVSSNIIRLALDSRNRLIIVTENKVLRV